MNLRSNDTIKVLNLYAGLGGNRFKWNNADVTAVEIDCELAKIYKQRFPQDNVIIGDAHAYLINNYKNYDFIWSSPPCTTHSRARFWAYNNKKPVYPDMKLYEEIIFLKYHCNAQQRWVVENVKSYYEPLLSPIQIGRHYLWANFKIPFLQIKDVTGKMVLQSRYEQLITYHQINSFDYNGKQNRLKILRNLFDCDLGLHIFNAARNICKQEIKYSNLFD